MICPSCLKDNADEVRFCAFCGAEIASSALTRLAAGEEPQMPEAPPIPEVEAPPEPQVVSTPAQPPQPIVELPAQQTTGQAPRPVPPPPTLREYEPPPSVTAGQPAKVSCGPQACIGCALLVYILFAVLLSAGRHATREVGVRAYRNPAMETTLEATVGSVHVCGLRLSKGIDTDKNPVGLTNVLVSPSDTEVYVHFSWRGASGQTAFRGQLLRNGQWERAFERTFVVDGAEGAGYFHYAWIGGFPPGQYTARIVIGDRLAGQIPFQVTGQQAPGAATITDGSPAP